MQKDKKMPKTLYSRIFLFEGSITFLWLVCLFLFLKFNLGFPFLLKATTVFGLLQSLIFMLLGYLLLRYQEGYLVGSLGTFYIRGKEAVFWGSIAFFFGIIGLLALTILVFSMLV